MQRYNLQQKLVSNSCLVGLSGAHYTINMRVSRTVLKFVIAPFKCGNACSLGFLYDSISAYCIYLSIGQGQR